MDTRREQIIDIVRREFIGPDPINKSGMIQDNGEEILSSDPPRIRYAAGILFPQKASIDSNTPDENTEVIENDTPDMSSDSEHERHGGTREYLADAEEMINLSNAYQQSAISMTAVVAHGDNVCVNVSAGMYHSIKVTDPETGIERVKYPRIPLAWNNDGVSIELPDETTGIKKYPVMYGEKETHLIFAITYRYKYEGYSLYTFTLQNELMCEASIKDEDCYFQVQFDLTSEKGFPSMPETEKLTNDRDYLSNQMLYRNIKTYAIGHGCAAVWDENVFPVKRISTCIFPMYEMKPIVPSKIDGVSLEMHKMSDYGSKEETIAELTVMCEKYASWISSLDERISSISDSGTAERHVDKCRQCLRRMEEGVELLKTNADILLAFQLMNRAMLMQQLHYNLPLQKWVCYDENNIYLENPVETLPDVNNQETWYGDKNRYGKWRPFQLAFVLMNLKSMAKKNCTERSIVDLIWFPTGGGKTEAYNMSCIREKSTKPEELVRKYLFSQGFRYRKNDARLPGKPDIVLPKYKTVIFVNGCFWHAHEGCRYFVWPKSNVDFWERKINGNIQRDLRNNQLLAEQGWNVIVIWECQLKNATFNETAQKLIDQIKELA